MKAMHPASLPKIVEALYDAGLRSPNGGERFSLRTVGRELKRLELHVPTRRAKSPKQSRGAQLERALADPSTPGKFREQLWADSDGHWRWRGRFNAEGFPVFGLADGDVMASRLAYTLEHGRVLERSERLHNVCGVRECVRADHQRLADSDAEFVAAMVRAQRTDQCVLYVNAPVGGYSRVRTAAGREVAHRVSYEKRYGPIPSGHHLHHLCRQPACITAAHLVPVPASGDASHKALHLLENELASLLAAGGPRAEGVASDATGWPGDDDRRRVGSLRHFEVNHPSENRDASSV